MGNIGSNEKHEANPMKQKTRPLILVILFLVIVSTALVLALRFTAGNEGVETDTIDPFTAAGREHSLGDAGKAEFLTIFVYDGEGGVSSFMVGGSTQEFQAFVAAVRDARRAMGEKDDSFSDLLVFSFSDQSTLELPYSRSRNLMAAGGQLFTPSSAIGPMIAGVEARFAR